MRTLTGSHSPVAFAIALLGSGVAPLLASLDAHSPVAFAMISFDTFAGTSP